MLQRKPQLILVFNQEQHTVQWTPFSKGLWPVHKQLCLNLATSSAKARPCAHAHSVACMGTGQCCRTAGQHGDSGAEPPSSTHSATLHPTPHVLD